MLVQSFGHHLLAGMVAGMFGQPPDTPLFRTCLLVAADIPQQSIRLGGVRRRSGADAYRLDQLDRLGERTIVYYDPCDWILPISRALMMPCHARLGLLGCAGLQVPEHITCQDVSDAGGLPCNPLRRHQYFIHSPAVVRTIADQIRS